MLDPEVVARLVARRRRGDRLETPTGREQEVFGLMAEGRANGAIAGRLSVGDGTVEKHVRAIFAKLGLDETEEDHRRVLTVLTLLRSQPA